MIMQDYRNFALEMFSKKQICHYFSVLLNGDRSQENVANYSVQTKERFDRELSYSEKFQLNNKS